MMKILKFNQFYENKNNIIGGLADNETIKTISQKHGVSIEQIIDQVERGIEVEREHTISDEIAQEIALDHLSELPDYYDRLSEIENSDEKNN